MKFTNGYWLVADGYHPLHPIHAYDVWTDEDAGTLTAYAPAHRVAGRHQTPSNPLLKVALSSPMADVVKVRIDHHTGVVPPRPDFPLATSEPEVTMAVGQDQATFTSGALSARIDRDPWRLSFEAHGKELTASGFRGIGAIEADDGRHFMHEQLDLGVAESIYGLGERFGPVVKNGQVVDVWNADGGTSSEQAYKNIPFYLSSAGYGVFVAHPERVSLEVASEKVKRVQFSVEGQHLEYYVIVGPSPKEVLAKYTALTGRPAHVPAWSYGLWLTTSFLTDYDEATVTGFIDGMRERDIPLSVFHYDCYWMRGFNWCDFEWDPDMFPDPTGQLARNHAAGLRVSVWINPYIAQRSRLFDEARDQGFLLRHPNGDVYQTDDWQAGMAIVDFTNPAAKAWYQEQLRALIAQGVDCFKTDFGERIPTDVVWHDGSDPQRMHNYFTKLYNEAVYEVLTHSRGENQAVLFARSATAGGQSFPVHWGGDCESTFESMAETLRGGLSLGLSGFGYWSHDIGGFEGTPEPSLYKRWLAFGLLSSHSRLHGSRSVRVPWSVDEESVDVARHFTKLKLSLMPYLLQAEAQAVEAGTPLLRHMLLEFPHDLTARHVETQYMLGDSLLVAPVFTPDGTVTYYVPAGTWTDFETGLTVQGPGWRTETVPAMRLPLLARPGSVIPVGSRTDTPEYDYADGVRLRCFQLPDGFEQDVALRGDGSQGGPVIATFQVRRTGNEVVATCASGQSGWSLEVDGVASDAADGAACVRLGSGA